MNSDLFTSSSIASSYQKFRPNYPRALYDEILVILEQEVRRKQTILDV